MIIHGECLEVLKGIADNSIDSVVTDPPYGISFMAKRWDYDVPSVEVWRECMRVLKPGGHMLVACGTRTQHRMAVNIEDAGFEIRDVVTWLYGQGFPKSLDISKAIDKEAGATREVTGIRPHSSPKMDAGNGVSGLKQTGSFAGAYSGVRVDVPITAPATEAAKQWDGWGTALKPACEFWTLARKPLSESTVAKNVLKWGTGALNIDATRIAGEKPATTRGAGEQNGRYSELQAQGRVEDDGKGRFPSNLILDERAAAMLDDQTQHLHGAGCARPSDAGTHSGGKSIFGSIGGPSMRFGDSGGASRFFYVAKASKSDRGEGNGHPTVKPTALMAYLCRLITPPGGRVLDPFAGSGSTGVAAIREGFGFIGIEREQDYVDIASRRISCASSL